MIQFAGVWIQRIRFVHGAYEAEELVLSESHDSAIVLWLLVRGHCEYGVDYLRRVDRTILLLTERMMNLKDLDRTAMVTDRADLEFDSNGCTGKPNAIFVLTQIYWIDPFRTVHRKPLQRWLLLFGLSI